MAQPTPRERWKRTKTERSGTSARKKVSCIVSGADEQSLNHVLVSEHPSYFCSGNICLSRGLHLVILRRLYETVVIPFRCPRRQQVRLLKNLQGARKYADFVNRIDSSADRHNISPWMPEMEDAVSELLEHCRPRYVTIQQIGGLPHRLSKIDYSRLEELHIEVFTSLTSQAGVQGHPSDTGIDPQALSMCSTMLSACLSQLTKLALDGWAVFALAQIDFSSIGQLRLRSLLAPKFCQQRVARYSSSAHEIVQQAVPAFRTAFAIPRYPRPSNGGADRIASVFPINGPLHESRLFRSRYFPRPQSVRGPAHSGTKQASFPPICQDLALHFRAPSTCRRGGLSQTVAETPQRTIPCSHTGESELFHTGEW